MRVKYGLDTWSKTTVILMMLVCYTEGWFGGSGGSVGGIQEADIAGTSVTFRLDDSVSRSDAQSKCSEIGTGYVEFIPATNNEVREIIEALDDFGETDNVWVVTSHDDSMAKVDAYSWSREPVEESLWFKRNRLSGGTLIVEPSDGDPCTVLRKKWGAYSSTTGKHMLGDKDCSSSSAIPLCVATPPTTQPPTTQPPTTQPPTTQPPTTQPPTTQLPTTQPPTTQPPTTQPPTTQPPTTQPPTTQPPTTQPQTTQPPTTQSPTTQPPTTQSPTTQPPTTQPPTTQPPTTQPPTTQPPTTQPPTTQPPTTQQPTTQPPTTQPPPTTEITTTENPSTENFSSQPSGKTTKTPSVPQKRVQTESLPVTVCPCECPKLTNKNLPSATNTSQEEFVNEKTEEIHKNLTLVSEDLSMTVRRKTSAPDTRPSSQVGGVIALVVIVIAFGAVAVSDVVVHAGFLFTPKKKT